MAALTASRSTPSQEIDLKGYLMGVATIWKGSMVMLNSAGFAVPASDVVVGNMNRVVGVADETVVNTGAAGSKKIKVRSGRSFQFDATSITQAMVGTEMSVVDDHTFDDAPSANLLACGILTEYVSAVSGYIFIPKGGIAK